MPELKVTNKDMKKISEFNDLELKGLLYETSAQLQIIKNEIERRVKELPPTPVEAKKE